MFYTLIYTTYGKYRTFKDLYHKVQVCGERRFSTSISDCTQIAHTAKALIWKSYIPFVTQLST